MKEHWLGEEEALRILTCCSDLLDALMVPLFTVILSDDKTDESCMASTESISGRQVRLKVCPDWKDYSDKQKVETLLHEMIHVTFFDTEESFDTIFRNSAPSSAATMWYSVSKIEYERMTSAWEKVLRKWVDFDYPLGTGTLVREQGDRLLREAP